MRNPRSLPGAVQLVITIVVIAGFSLLAGVAGLRDPWDLLAGAFVGSLLLGLWESLARPARDG